MTCDLQNRMINNLFKIGNPRIIIEGSAYTCDQCSRLFAFYIYWEMKSDVQFEKDSIKTVMFESPQWLIDFDGHPRFHFCGHTRVLVLPLAKSYTSLENSYFLSKMII